jgi:hypothetical protein
VLGFAAHNILSVIVFPTYFFAHSSLEIPIKFATFKTLENIPLKEVWPHPLTVNSLPEKSMKDFPARQTYPTLKDNCTGFSKSRIEKSVDRRKKSFLLCEVILMFLVKQGI